MCELAAAPLAPRLRVSSAERRAGGTGRTYDTLVWLEGEHPARRFALALGSDLLAEVDRWYRFEELSARVPLVVVGRAGYPSPRATPLELPALSSSLVRERLARGEGAEGLVPAAVARYVSRHGLYRDIL